MNKFQKYLRNILSLVLIALTLVICFCIKKELSGLEALVEAVGKRRFTEARLSGGFSYGPLELPLPEVDKQSHSSQEPFLLSDNKQRGGNNKKSLEKAALSIYNQLGNQPSQTKLHELGVFSLLSGRYTESIDYLENALTKGNKTALLLNDLTVAYLERGEQQKRAGDFIHALSLIDEAFSLDKSLVEIQFNRALVLEKLSLISGAQKAWKEYKFIEQNPQWQQEAQAHIALLEQEPEEITWARKKKELVMAVLENDKATSQAIVSNFPHLSRVYALEELMPQWATAIQAKNKEDATKTLQIATLIGQILNDLQGDKEITDMTKAIVDVSSKPELEIILATAHLHYAAGKKAFDIYENEKAEKLFEQAKSGYSQANDEASRIWTIFQQIRCDVIRLDYKKADERINSIDKLIEQHSYLYLRARVLWNKGLIYGYQYDLSKALEAKQITLKYLEQLADKEGIVHLNLLIFLSLVDIGKREEIWPYFIEACKISKMPNSFWYTTILYSLFGVLTRIDELRPAQYIYQEMEHQILITSNEPFKCAVMLWHSKLSNLLGNQQEALANLNTAKEYLEKISDPANKKNVERELLLTEADYQLSLDPQKAITTYNKVLDNIAEGYQVYTTHIYSSRAKAYLAIHDYDKAEADLDAGIKTFESQRSKITDERYRLSFFEEPQTIYENMIKFQINQRQRPNVAFDYVELARSRSLLDAIDGRAKAVKLDTHQELQLQGTAKPLNLEEIQQRLPKAVTLVRYLMTADRVFAWVVTKDKVDLVEQQINEPDLERQIFRLRKTLIDFNSEPPAIQAAVSPVYQAIFAKVKPYIKAEQGVTPRVIIVPDKSLYAVPFAALVDPDTKHYLIEDMTLGFAPSATVYIRCLEKDQKLTKNAQETVLAIGNPTFSQKHFENMRYLSGAETEAETVSKMYPKSKLLLTKDATKEAFLKDISKYDVIHYAGHALVDPSSPLFSKLLLAPPGNASSDYDEAVYAHEIYGQKFTHTKLVVLAACRTAGGLRTHGEGMISLARPFLASGVPAVIASLWDADDNGSLKLFKIFHQERLAGHDSVTAMRNAQLELLKHPDFLSGHPRVWALFQVIGGVEPEK